MAFSLRLPPDLDLEARRRADQIGVPLNGLICFALDFYLRSGVSSDSTPSKLSQASKAPSNPPSEALKASPAPTPLPAPPLPGAKLSKAQRREITAHARLARKS